MKIQQLVAEAVQKCTNNIAVVYENGTNSKSITYKQLWETSQEIASFFSTLHMSGKIAAVIQSENVHLPSVLVGLLSCKCAFYPVNGGSGQRSTSEGIKRVGASWIIYDFSFHQVYSPIVDELHGQCVPCDVLEKLGMKLIQLPVRAVELKSDKDCVAYCITTSGTTGSPKVIRVPHACIVPNIIDLRRMFQMNQGDKVLLAAPLTFDPSIIDIFLALTSGATLLMIPETVKNNPVKFLHIVHSKQNVTVMQATPSLIRQCSAYLLRETIFGSNSSLRVHAFGGENFPSTSELKRWVSPKNKTQFYNLYGITEVSCWASVEAVDVQILIKNNGIVSIGIPLSKTLIHIDKAACSDKDEGFIWIGSSERVCELESDCSKSAPNCDQATKAGMFPRSSCWSQRDMAGDNSKTIVWRNTGDLGHVLQDGRIVCLGRKDDQVKRHGKRMTLSALQQVCCELPWVSNCCALMDDNSRLVLYFTTETSGKHYLHADAIREKVHMELCKETEPEYYGLGESSVKLVATDCEFSHMNHGENKSSTLSVDGVSEDLKLKAKELKIHVQDALPSHYMPDRFIQCSALPVNAHGKLDKRKLLKMTKVETPALDLSLGSPLCMSKKLWQTFLPKVVQEISSEDTFLSVGGDSLAAVNLVNHLEQSLGNPAQHFMDILVNKDFLSFVEYLSSFVRGSDLSRESFVGKETNFNKETININSVRKKGIIMNSQQVCDTSHVVESTENKNVNNLDLYDDENNATNMSNDLDIAKSPLVFNAQEKRNGVYEFCVICRGNKVTRINQQLKSFNILFHKKFYCDCMYDGCGNLNSEAKHTLCKRCHGRSKKEMSNISGSEFCDRNKFDNSGNKEDYIAKRKRNIQTDTPDFDSTSGKESVPRQSLHQRWKVDTKKCVDASPVIVVLSEAQIVAFIGSHSGHFSAVDVHSGKTNWTTLLPDRIESSANICQNFAFVVVGCYDGVLYFLDIKSGEIKWQFQTGDSIKCSPSVDTVSGRVICGSHDGWLYSLDVEARECTWKYHLGGGSIYSSPLVDQQSGLVYAASLGGKLVSLSLGTGLPVWCVELKKPLFSSPCFHGKSVLIGCVDGLLYCVDDSSKIVWTFKTEGPIFSSPISQDGFVFFGCHDNSFYCLTSNGELVWKFKTGSPVFSTPFLFHFPQKYCNSSSNLEDSGHKKNKKSLVVFANTNGAVNVLDSSNGSVVTSTHLPGEVFSSPVVYQEHIVIGCRDNFLYCFDVPI